MAKWKPSPNFLPGRTAIGTVQSDSHQVTGSLLVTGSLTVNGVAITGSGGGGGSLTVKESDGSPSVSSVTTINVSNGTLTNDGGGEVTIITGGGGGSPDTPLNSIQFNEASSFGGDADLTWTGQAVHLTGTFAISKSVDDSRAALIINPGPVGDYQEGLRINEAASGFAVLSIGGPVDSVAGTNDFQWDFVKDDGVGIEARLELRENGSRIMSWDGDTGNIGMGDYTSVDGCRVVIDNNLWLQGVDGKAHQVTGTLDVSGSVMAQIVTASVFRVDGNLGGVGGLWSMDGYPLYIGMDPDPTVDGGIIEIGHNIQLIVSGGAGIELEQGGGFVYEGDTSGGDEPPKIAMDMDGMLEISNRSGSIVMDADSGDFFVAVGSDGYLAVGDGVFEVQDGTGSFMMSGGTGSLSGKLTADLFYNSINDAGTINGSQTLDGSQSNVFQLLYDGATQLTMSNQYPGASYLIFVSNSAGDVAVTYDPNSFRFPNGTPPTNSTGSGEVDILSGISDGTYLYADMTKKFS